MDVLVTGGTGRLGRLVVERLTDGGHRVRQMSRRGTGPGGVRGDLATGRDLPVAVDIRRGTQQLFHAALPGSTADNDAWIQRKARTVERYGASSYLVGRRLAAKGQELDAGMGVDPAAYAAHGGGFPIQVPHVGVVGVITVSGLPQADDHALVVEAIEAYLSGD